MTDEKILEILRNGRRYFGAAYLEREVLEFAHRLLTKANVPEWISVDERLPAEYDFVRCKLADGLDRIARLGHGKVWQFAEFFHGNYHRNKYPPIAQRDNPVIAWMPLPPAPEISK